MDSILACFNSCKYLSTINLRLGYYHIRLSNETVEKTAFVADKSKWIFHSHIGPSAFSNVLGKVLVQCSEFALSYFDDIMVFSET